MESSDGSILNSPGISIVIPAYNEEKYLPETISYIDIARRKFSAQFALPTELIVVDNASTDSTAKAAQELGARVLHHETRNIASVRNAGIKGCLYDIVITVDADTFIPPDTFTAIWTEMSTGKYIGGAVRLGIRTEKFYLKLFVGVMEWLMVKISGLSGGMFFFCRNAALAIGAFPETHLIAEDMTFAKNLRAYGIQRGRRFRNPRSVTILTFDRKDVSFWRILDLLYKALKIFLGAKHTKEELGYWYAPKR